MPKATKWTGSDEQVQDVIDRHRTGSTVRAIAAHYSCRSGLISDTLRDRGYRIYRGREKVLADVKDRMVAQHLGGATIRAISRDSGMSEQGVSKLLTRWGVKAEKWSTWTPERYAELRAMFDGGLSASEIARRTGLSQASVSHRLRQTGVPPQPSRSGAAHGGWKGGRIIVGGYVFVRPTAADLAFCVPNSSGYVAEHRLIMGRALGRPLTDSETVHHINGAGLDNSEANLQLRQGKHGSGVALTCRACGSHDVDTDALV